MIVILLIGGLALAVAVIVAAAIAAFERQLPADARPWPFEGRGCTVGNPRSLPDDPLN
jgi:hypothetical protein